MIILTLFYRSDLISANKQYLHVHESVTGPFYLFLYQLMHVNLHCRRNCSWILNKHKFICIELVGTSSEETEAELFIYVYSYMYVLECLVSYVYTVFDAFYWCQRLVCGL